LFIVFLSFWFGLKNKKPAIDWQSRAFESLVLNQSFVPTMPKRRQSRIQMDRRPLTCACFGVGANVVFMFFTGKKETLFRDICQKVFCAVKNALSDFNAVLN
jgi:hypothetical protein